MKKPSCLNPTCSLHGNVASRHIIRYGFYRTTAGKRRRYRCIRASGADRRFRPRKAPPTIVSSTVEQRSTRSSRCASRASISPRSRGSNGWPGTPSPAGSSGPLPCVANLAAAGPPASSPQELQADEIRSFTGGKRRPAWVFAAIEVWSRLWTSTVVGRRSYRNTLALVRNVASRMTFVTGLLIVIDGFKLYGTVIRLVFGPAALYAQVIKTRRHDRVVRVDRRAVIGAA